jgi:hypothetical protein
MEEAKISIVESRRDAQTLIEPVRKPVAVLRTIRNAAARIERRATEVFAAYSVFTRKASFTPTVIAVSPFIREIYQEYIADV